MYVKSSLFGFFVLFAITGPARASIVEIGPFVGVLTESWETFRTNFGEGNYMDSPVTIMGGAATIANPFMSVYEPSAGAFFPLGNSGSAQAADGAKAMGIQLLAQTATIEFIDPILDFGAFWGAATSSNVNVGNPALIEVSFFASDDVLIGTQEFEYSRSTESDGLLEWHGWSSSIPIEKITYTEDRVAIDGLQANPVPEPWMICLGTLPLFLVRRRKLARHVD